MSKVHVPCLRKHCASVHVATGERGRSWPAAALQSPIFFAFFALPIDAFRFSRSNRCSALGILVATAVTAPAPAPGLALCLPKCSAFSPLPRASSPSLFSHKPAFFVSSSHLFPPLPFPSHSSPLPKLFPLSTSNIRIFLRTTCPSSSVAVALFAATSAHSPLDPAKSLPAPHKKKKESGDAFDLLPTSYDRLSSSQSCQDFA